MSITALPAADVFRTQPLRGLPEGVKEPDRKAGWIYGAKAMQFGPLNDGDMRPWKADATTLAQVVKLVNQSKTGTKSRFAHPNMSRDGMGRHLGRVSNARIEGEDDEAYVAVDIKLADASKRTPNGNLFDHVFDMAEESPEDFGLSIAPVLDREAMSKIEPDENGLIPIRLKSLRAIDFVDEPAATRGGLFSLDSDHVADLPAQATWMLDTFFGDAPADVIRGRFDEFLKTYLTSRGEPMSTQTEQQKPSDNADLAALKAEVESLKAQLATKENATESSDVAAKEAKAIASLERRSQLEAICRLAKCEDKLPDFIASGLSVDVIQSRFISAALANGNPPISEGGTDLGEKKQTPDEKFGAEWDQHKDVFEQQGTSREAYIKSRRIDEGLDKITLKLKTA